MESIPQYYEGKHLTDWSVAALNISSTQNKKYMLDIQKWILRCFYIQKHIMNIEIIAPMASIIAAIMSEFLTWPKINKDFGVIKKVHHFLKWLSLMHDDLPY